MSTHDDRAVQRQAGGNRIFSQLFQDIFHRLVQINLHHITLTGFTEFGRNQFTRIAVSFSIQIPSLLILHLMLRSAEQKRPNLPDRKHRDAANG